MKIAKDTMRSTVRVGYDGKVYKTFRGTNAKERFDNETRVLKVLEARGCDFVPRYIDSEPETLTLITTNCGHSAPKLSDEKVAGLFKTLEQDYRVVHDDPFARNITYHPQKGAFCIIDFELAQVLDEDDSLEVKRLTWAGVTQAGKRKKGNDDSLAVFSSEAGWGKELMLRGEQSLAEDGLVLAVSDGMGGVAGGALASSLCVNELRRFLPGRMGDFRNLADPLETMEAAIVDLADYVNRAAEARPEFAGMGATLVAGLFYRSQVYFAHVGDSRMYRFREGTLSQLTFDQSRVGQQFLAGKLNERQARSHPQRSVLSQVIGGRCQFLRPQLGDSSLRVGDWYLICSDGVIDGLWDKHIDEFLRTAQAENRSPKDVADDIMKMALAEAGMDDTTLFVIRISA